MDYAFERPDLIAAGATLNRTYANALRQQKQLVRQEQRTLTPADFEIVRQAAYRQLELTAPDERGRVLIGAIASVYSQPNPGNDGVAWLMGELNDKGLREPGFAQLTMQEMRKIGVLNDLIPDPSGRGLIQYQPPQRVGDRPAQTIGINGTWRNFFDMMAEQINLPSFDDWDVSTASGKSTRKRFARLAAQKVAEFMATATALELEIRAEDWKGQPRKVLYSTRTGKKFGTVDKGDADRYQVGQRITITGSLVSKEGNIRALANVFAAQSSG